jgi:hypothetical protein
MGSNIDSYGYSLSLIMKRASDSHQAQSAISSTPPATDSNFITDHFTPERWEYPPPPTRLLSLISRTLSDTRASVFSDVSARVESRFNHFRSVIHDPSARVAAISTVDREVDAAMRLIHSLRNALAPISLLPPELLARVFHFLSLEEPPYSRNQDLGWIRATHVCRFWRQVALGDSSLWARISGIPTNAEWISETFARARNARLDFDIDFHRTLNPEVLLMFPPHISHTRTLRLTFYPHISHPRELRPRGLSKSHSENFRCICFQEAPALEHFELRVLSTHPINYWDLSGTMLFNGRAPMLRTFSLFRASIPWSLIPRGQLTQLEISHSYYRLPTSDVPSHGDLNQLIDLLVNCPELEVLVLESCLPSQLIHVPYGQTIHLPHLFRLRLGGSSSRITNFLKSLKLPTSTTLQLHCTRARNDNLLLAAVSAHLQSSVPVEFKKLRVNLNCMRAFEVSASTSLPKSKISQSQDFESYVDEEFVLSFDKIPSEDLIIEHVCKMLPISNLEFLSIWAPSPFDRVCPEPFRRCHGVTTVQATGRGASSFVRALTTPKLADTGRGLKRKKLGHYNGDGTSVQLATRTALRAQAPIFPKLKFLSLQKLNFCENKPLDSLSGPPSILFDVVQNGLRQRKVDYRAPLDMLCIDNCSISTKQAYALQRHVKKLLWDGKGWDGYEDRQSLWDWVSWEDSSSDEDE